MYDPYKSRAEKIKAKYGEDFYKKAGAIGGKAKNPNKGFGHSDGGRERAAACGRKARKKKQSN